MKYIFGYDFKIGKLWIAEKDGKVCGVHFDGRIPSGFEITETDVIKSAAVQLGEYFEGKRKNFDLTLDMGGTEFQRTVWTALLTVNYGETRSYKDIAVQIGRPKACRAVGMANNKNPLAIIVPCHRVCGHNGGLTGYAGGLDIKQILLDLERKS